MTFQRPLVHAPAEEVAIVETPNDLAAIHRPNCAAALWRRDPLAQFKTWIDALPAERLPQARIILKPEAARQAMQEVIAQTGEAETVESVLLAEDIAALAMIFADVMQAPYLWLRLDVVAGNGCT